MSYVKKLLSSSRTLIVLLSITMAFTIAIYFNSKKGRGTESPPPAKVADVGIDFSAASSSQQEDLKAIRVKLDVMSRDIMMRDTVIVKEILRLQHSNGMHQEKNPMCPSCARSSRQNVAKVLNLH
jgi:hypothetical protein|tara:strand:- start:8247 stop:8621 length:375 start_codon:yes stop_codon:yes gene_type:complete